MLSASEQLELVLESVAWAKIHATHQALKRDTAIRYIEALCCDFGRRQMWKEGYRHRLLLRRMKASPIIYVLISNLREEVIQESAAENMGGRCNTPPTMRDDETVALTIDACEGPGLMSVYFGEVE